MFMDYNCSWGQGIVSVGKGAKPDNLRLIPRTPTAGEN